jgi:ribosomal protein L29
MPDLGLLASLLAVPIAAVTVVFAYLTWREARATVKPLRLMADEQREALAQERAEHRLEQLHRIGVDVAAARADLATIEFADGRASGSELKTLRRALADLRMALQSQPTDALPHCRELIRAIPLDAVHLVHPDTLMLAVSEIEAALQATAPA